MLHKIVFLSAVALCLLSACRRQNGLVENNGTLRALPPTAAQNPYTFTQTEGSISVRTISGIPYFAEVSPNDDWLQVEAGGAMHRVLGGFDTIGIFLQEFFDKANVDVRRQGFVTVRANGLQPISVAVEQRSFPFIFDKVKAGKANTTIVTNENSLTRNGKEWSLVIANGDSLQPIAITLLHRAPYTLHLVDNGATSGTNSFLKFVVADVTATDPMNLHTTDTTVQTGTSPLILQGQTKWRDNTDRTFTLHVTQGEEVALLHIRLAANGVP